MIKHRLQNQYGVRSEELHTLKVKHVIIKHQVYKISLTKNKKNIHIVMCKPCCCLQAHAQNVIVTCKCVTVFEGG